MFLAIIVLLIVLAGVAYWYKDEIAKWFPGWKHSIAGWFTTISSFIVAVAEYFKTVNFGTLFSDPKTVTLIGMGLGLIILILSWVTPRAKSE